MAALLRSSSRTVASREQGSNLTALVGQAKAKVKASPRRVGKVEVHLGEMMVGQPQASRLRAGPEVGDHEVCVRQAYKEHPMQVTLLRPSVKLASLSTVSLDAHPDGPLRPCESGIAQAELWICWNGSQR
mmetsp:Transcript_10532/g.27284  ORF Transcript_10532/g.27284 Transcript_10532/m.27284 type:complete len:130 (+) Transcript_10532:411-800(+)